MSCCAPALDGHGGSKDLLADAARAQRLTEWLHSVRQEAEGIGRLVLSVPDMHCGACIAALESGVSKISGVLSVRANLTLRRLIVMFDSNDADVLDVIEKTVQRLGYDALPVDLGDLDAERDRQEARRLLIALAVAGFATANIMLLSVSVWSGAEASTGHLFHFVSLLIAVPAVAFAGRPFFTSALSAVRAGRVNMDVPIALALLLSLGMSITRTIIGEGHIYFDAAVMLTFFLLIGRYLDQRMRERARSAVISLTRMAPKGARVVADNGQTEWLPADELRPGDIVRLTTGERLAVDAIVMKGEGTVDRSLVTGESEPVAAAPGTRLEAGVLALSAPLDLRVEKTANKSFLSEIATMMEAAEQGRGETASLTDRLAGLYAPVVHALAALTFVGWMLWSADIWTSLDTAVAVLIVTCPCALGLAVPVVHVIAAARLFESGILMRNGDALERLAEADHVIFDKTGTLTTGRPRVAKCLLATVRERSAACELARHSSHPAAMAVADYLDDSASLHAEAIREVPAAGIEARLGTKIARLGRADWVADIARIPAGIQPPATGLAFAFEGETVRSIEMAESLRPQAIQTVNAIRERGLAVELLSGDGPLAVSTIAERLGIEDLRAECRPADKLERLDRLRENGAKVLMVGDGLNDAPSLAGAHVSFAPGSACDVGRLAADFVFTRPGLDAVENALTLAQQARRLVRQNLTLAICYNILAVPLAMTGFVTPLIAALLMSGSSILVVGNALRLSTGNRNSADQVALGDAAVVVTPNGGVAG
ncbi:heavy metal translocating P-type ATPase [Notoacmeibacter sp. MSK16QG-6]|uniref:heavy metal translocating P-type ATPase n=1 Tax=Notoacmeibacter sp. MSK16QG-6 TaxID=2957982 RepID=UPI0020A1C232|nr:heavy metal translocating P-type ATPase [Notoacmeibacter sp. MSK16QG-6]MCP1198659.1 heavy metal translocating P-type ATPase [Notoacmeibacter sp. MSK16QG-6]